MAAKPLPDLALWTVQVVNPGVVNVNQAMKIGPTDTVAFHNGCTFPITISFSGVFGTIANLQPGATSAAIGGNPLNLTVDYSIVNATTQQMTGGPYAIQFGIGPLLITVGGLNTSPDPIMIPNGGQIQFNCDVKYNISWKFKLSGQSAPGVWAPQLTQLPAGLCQVMTAQAGANSASLAYTITAATETRGGGTVVVSS